MSATTSPRVTIFPNASPPFVPAKHQPLPEPVSPRRIPGCPQRSDHVPLQVRDVASDEACLSFGKHARLAHRSRQHADKRASRRARRAAHPRRCPGRVPGHRGAILVLRPHREARPVRVSWLGSERHADPCEGAGHRVRPREVLRVVGSGYRDDPHAGGLGRPDAGGGVFDHQARLRAHAQRLRTLQVGLRVGLAFLHVFCGHDAVRHGQPHVLQLLLRYETRARRDHGPAVRGQGSEKFAGALYFEHPVESLDLDALVLPGLRGGVELRGNEAYGFGDPAPVADLQHAIDVEAVLFGPLAPDAHYARGGVHQHAVHVEQDRIALEDVSHVVLPVRQFTLPPARGLYLVVRGRCGLLALQDAQHLRGRGVVRDQDVYQPRARRAYVRSNLVPPPADADPVGDAFHVLGTYRCRAFVHPEPYRGAAVREVGPADFPDRPLLPDVVQIGIVEVTGTVLPRVCGLWRRPTPSWYPRPEPPPGSF